MNLKSILIIVMLVLLACSSSKQPLKIPLQDQYPEDKYLAVIGIGDTEEEARSQAKAELSYMFVSKIRSETLDRVKLIVNSTGYKTTERTLRRQIQVSSNVELSGVEIADVWSARGNFYAFAVLERKKAKDNWMMELEDMDQQVEGSIRSAWAPESNLVKYKLLKEAIALWIKREAVASRLLVVGVDAMDIETPYEMVQVFGELNKIKAETKIYIFITGEYSGIVRENISERLSRAGYVFATNPKTANVIIKGTVSVERLSIEAPDLTYANASLSLNIKDIAADVSLGDISEKRRGAHIYYNEAVQTALKKIISSASAQLIRLFEGS